jgi:glutathione S-transferase
VGEEAALISRKGSCQRLTIRNDSQKERIMKQRVQVIGNLLSPYVRKVLVCLDLKGVPYEIDPIVPFFGDDRFSQVSPVRRIPVLVDEQVTLADSSVICQYLEDRYPEPNLYPANIVDRARARWLEEFADSRMGEVFIWKLFNQVAIKPFVWGEPTDTAVVEKTLREEIPQVLDYLEAQAPEQGFIFGALSIADISLACFFRNAAFARFRVDAARWPLTAAFVERVLKIESFEKLKPFEDRLRRTPLGEHRAALAEMGVPLTRDTHGTSTPRRGMMHID